MTRSQLHQSVEDDDANVICLGARVVGASLAAELTRTFLNAKFRVWNGMRAA